MRSIFYYHFLILAPILARNASADQNGPSETVLNRAIDILFGRLWRFNEYCGDSRQGRIVLEDDIEIESFYNGTAMYSLAISNESTLLWGLNQLNYLGIKSRSMSTILCSINNWGYVEEEDFNLSNQPFDNKSDCLKRIDGLYDALDHSSTGKVLAPFCTTDISNYAGLSTNNSKDFSYGNCSRARKSFNQTIHEWIQLNNFGRIPAGSTSNVHILFGDYNGCMRLPDMRYCYGAYRMRQWPADPSPNTLNAYRIGLCLPRTCNSLLSNSSGYLEKIDMLLKYNLIRVLGFDNAQSYRLEEIYCPPADDSHYRQAFKTLSSKLLIVIALIWLALLISATILNPYCKRSKPKSTFQTLTDTFDLRSSWTHFKHDAHLAPELAGVNGLKVIHFIWLMSSHMYMLFTSYSNNKHEMRLIMNNSYLASAILQGNHAVPIYFIISGLLVGHKHLRREIDFPRMVIYRYIRLLPMYLVVYMYVKNFAYLLATGPLWDYGVSIQSEARQCRMESWLVPILMLSNFIPPFSHCIITGWHIANDFQTILLIPFLLYAYKRSRPIGTFVALSGFIISHLHHIWNYHSSNRWIFRQPALEPHIFGPRAIMERLSYDYVNPIGRFGTVFMGVLLADLLILRETATTNVHQTSTTITEMSAVTGDSVNSKSTSAKMEESTSTEDCLQTQPQTKMTRNCEILNSSSTPLVDFLLKFKDTFLLILGGVMFSYSLFCPAFTPNTKFVLGSYSNALTYPLTRVLIELGAFLFLYVLLCGQKQQMRTTAFKPIRELDETESSRINTQPSSYNNSSNVVGDLLRRPFWNILVKLNYSLMLVHFTIARYLIQSRVQLLTFSWLNYLQYSTFLILISYLVCCIVHLAIEMPLTSLIKLLVDKLDGSKRSENRHKSVN